MEYYIRLYSFDIFDTLITRNTANPKGIFAIIQNELKQYKEIPDYIKENFFEIRIATERYLRKYACSNEIQEITLEQIYDEIALNNCLSSEIVGLLKQIEKKVEVRNVLPVSENIDIIRNLLNNNKRVILISDMYHSTSTIREILCNVDSIFKNITIYVSSQYKKNKYTGDLYKIVHSIENIDYKDWQHMGDNMQVDIEAAKKLGINTVYFPSSSLTEHERFFIKTYSKELSLQLALGVIKNIKVLNPNNTNWIVGVSIGGPLLYLYVNWILEQSKKRILRNYILLLGMDIY